MTTYLFHTTLLISGFTLFYWYVLRHETYFRLNRWIILGGALLCLAIPTIQIPASMSFWNNTNAPTESIIETLTQAQSALVVTPNTSKPEYPNTQAGALNENEIVTSTFSWTSILGILYLIGVVIFFLIFLIQVVILLTQRYNLNSFQAGKYTIVEMVKDTEPCSFLNFIYINPSKYDEETYDHIIEHEKAHIDQSHFVDKVIAELLIVLFWFNPFTWLLRKSIGQNLEFLTDQSLLNQGIQKDKYQMSLLKVSVSNRPLNLTASYNSSFLKSRIKMMNGKNSSVVSAWKYLFIVPLFILSIASLNAIQDSGNYNNFSNESGSNATTSNQKTEIIPGSKDSNYNLGHVSKEIDLPHFDKIGLAISGNLILSQGEEQKITISGPQDLVDQISTDVIDDNWNIGYKTPGHREGSTQINVYAQLPEVTILALSGTGTIRSTNRFHNLKELTIALSGTGDIDFTCNANSIKTALSGTGNIAIDSNAKKIRSALSGSGNMTLKGQVNQGRFELSGSGSISALELQTNNTSIVIDGSSSISLRVKDKLDIIASGSAYVKYIGDPVIIKDLQSESRLEKIE